METKPKFILCIENKNHPVLIESGEDYLYSEKFFAPIKLPQIAEDAFMALVDLNKSDFEDLNITSVGLQEFVYEIRRIHDDNMNFEYFAKHIEDKTEHSTMPITAFIYEYFVYNSLYSVDWKQSIHESQLITHGDKLRQEIKQQNKFVTYLNEIAKNNLDTFKDSFQKLATVNIESKWTDVDPDNKVDGITVECGKKFFKDLKALQIQVNPEKSFDESKLGKAIPLIRDCFKFIYKVRCNIFHGSKHIYETSNEQKGRIEIYHLFLSCLVLSFLQLIEKTTRSLSSKETDEKLMKSI